MAKKAKKRTHTLLERIAHLHPCSKASRWLARQKTPLQAWRACTRPDWMIWFICEALGTRAVRDIEKARYQAGLSGCCCRLCDPTGTRGKLACDIVRKFFPKVAGIAEGQMTLAYLNRLAPGTHFRLPTMPEVRGELLDCSDCSARVRLLGGVREIVFEDRPGHVRRFVAQTGRDTSWAPGTLVEIIMEVDHVPTA